MTSNLPFSRRGDVFSDHVVAAAMIDRIVHHAEVLTLKGNSYRLRNTEIDTPVPTNRQHGRLDTNQQWPIFEERYRPEFKER